MNSGSTYNAKGYKLDDLSNTCANFCFSISNFTLNKGEVSQLKNSMIKEQVCFYVSDILLLLVLEILFPCYVIIIRCFSLNVKHS